MEQYSLSFAGESVRVDSFLSKQLVMTRTAVVRLMESELVCVNGKPTTKNYKLKPGDVVEVTVPDPIELAVEPEDIPLSVLYEDADLLVVNKPKGMVVHPAPGHPSGTLVNALLHHCKGELSGINGIMRPGIVHRIDKDTSGLLMVAKSESAHLHLAAQIKEHSFVREYEAVVLGRMKEQSGVIELPIGRHPVKRKQMAVSNHNSKPAKTEFSVLAEANGFSHLRLKLFTGRTHQIRVHLSYVGHPVAGDPVYGGETPLTKCLNGQCLHAKKIGFIHPRTEKYLEFESELPNYFTAFLKEKTLYGAF